MIDQYDDSGLGILELGHRSDQYRRLHQATIEQLRVLLDLPAAYEVLLLHGGARTQFAMLPANLLPDKGTANYLESGYFAADAAVEAAAYGPVHIGASSRDDRYCRLPDVDNAVYTADATYLHYTSNNTEIGTQFPQPPQPPPGTWLACDASSDLLTRPLDIRRHGCIYATSHKNLGTAGVTVVILRRDLLDPVRKLPTIWSYQAHARADSRLNTPPVSAVYVLNLMTRWTIEHGGVTMMHEHIRAKSRLLYGVLDDSDEFYRPLVTAIPDRSTVNVTFAAPTADLEEDFQQEAHDAGLIGLWGYRKVGHLRASLFNAITTEHTYRLADFMQSFARRHRRRMPAPSDAARTRW